MKQFRLFSFTTALLLATALLIAAFIIMFSYTGFSSNDKSVENTSVVNEPAVK